jgi:hypothetical protein
MNPPTLAGTIIGRSEDLRYLQTWIKEIFT